jgi:precorrin-4/cobalt-precorrin-4 C11-methyltransferase
MVLFLSTGLLPKVTEELIAGGYAPDAPAAIVYKASWPDEKVFRCTVGTLEETAKANGITKTALITVGGFLNSDFARSQLYHPDYSTEYRPTEYREVTK